VPLLERIRYSARGVSGSAAVSRAIGTSAKHVKMPFEEGEGAGGRKKKREKKGKPCMALDRARRVMRVPAGPHVRK
jgi:hypothetical protein